jgi:hypothetical protein
MTLVRNPFDAGGYSLAEMTQAINILPNLYTRLGQIGLFRFEGVSQRSVIIEQYEGVLSLLPSVPLGGPATVGTREGRSMRSFALPWIPHDDVILPGDIQGQPALGAPSMPPIPLVEVMNRKLQLMRRKHAQTREYMEMNALRGIVKDGAGTTLYNYFTEFGLAQISVDFVLGTAGTNVQGKVREVLRAIEDNLLGEACRRPCPRQPRVLRQADRASEDRGGLQVLRRDRRAAPARGCAPQLPLRGHPVRGILRHRHPLDQGHRTAGPGERRASPSRWARWTPSPPMAARRTCWRRPTPSACRSTPASTSTKRAAGST